MKLLPLRFIPLGLAAILLVTILWVSPAGHWLENTGSIFLLLVLALVFPYLCFIWLTTLMTPPTAPTSGSEDKNSQGNQDLTRGNSSSQDLGNTNLSNNSAVNAATNIASNIISSLTPNNAKKVNSIIDGGDDSSTILMALPSKSPNDGLVSDSKENKSPEKEPRNILNRRNFFTGEPKTNDKNKVDAKGQPEPQALNGNISGKTAPSNTSSNISTPAENSTADDAASHHRKHRPMRIRYRGAWVDYD